MTRDDLELFATILWTLAPFIVIVAVFFTACIMVAITTIKALKGDFDAPIPKTRRRKTAYGLQLKKPTAMVRKQYTHWEFKPTDEELLNEARAMLTEAEEDDTTIWKFERDTNYEHPTSKPVKLPAKAILNSSKPGEIVLDLFAGGGGSTLMAADATGRICYTMELDERYVDVVSKRYAKSIGREEDWEEATPEVQA